MFCIKNANWNLNRIGFNKPGQGEMLQIARKMTAALQFT
jgi:hypothetical protein